MDVLLFISSQLLVPLYFRRQSNLPVHHRWCKPTPAYIFPAWFNNKLMADIKFFCSTICLCSLIMVSNFDEPKKSWQNAFAFIGRACNLREKFSLFFLPPYIACQPSFVHTIVHNSLSYLSLKYETICMKDLDNISSILSCLGFWEVSSIFVLNRD